MREKTYVVDYRAGRITAVTSEREVVYANGEFVVADSPDGYQIYFRVTHQTHEQFRTAGGFAWNGEKYIFISEHPAIGENTSLWSGTLEKCIYTINNILNPPNPFLNHEL